MKQIRVLGNRLDKIMIKYNEALSIKKTYELISQRLDEERGTYESQLAKIEDSLQGKGRDLSELTIMSQDAVLSKQSVEKELNRFEAKANTSTISASRPKANKSSVGADLEFDLQNETQDTSIISMQQSKVSPPHFGRAITLTPSLMLGNESSSQKH